MKIKILIPVFNDWQSVFKLIEEINDLSIDPKFEVSIIIVNDASNHDRQEEEESRIVRCLHLQSAQASAPRDWNLQEIHVHHELLHP